MTYREQAEATIKRRSVRPKQTDAVARALDPATLKAAKRG